MNKKYQIIYADPPWEYDDKKNNDPAMGGITYPVMKLEEIKKLRVNEISDNDASLFLWVTMPMLNEGLSLINSWGFQYRTCAFVWVKTNQSGFGIYSGLGHWTKGNAELCLFGKRGRPKRCHKDIRQIVLSPLMGHSRKPSIIRENIVALMGDLPRVELFARRKVDGWDCWGNEVESDIDLMPSSAK